VINYEKIQNSLASEKQLLKKHVNVDQYSEMNLHLSEQN
jgi:hypothetical protein